MGNSKLKMNLLFEQVLIESHVHVMYEEILKEEDYKVSEEDKSVIKKIGEDLKLNTNLIFTYGVGMGAFVGPVTELLYNAGFKMTKPEVSLLIITSLYILLNSSKEDIKKLLQEVKNKGLTKQFESVNKFIKNVFDLFKVVAKKVGVVANNLVDILSFTFISVPVLSMIKNLVSENGLTVDDFKSMSAGLILSVSSYLVKNLLKKRIKESEFDDFDFVPEFKENPARDFLYNLMQDLQMLESKKQPGWVVYKDRDGKILMVDDANINQKNPGLYVDYDKIWLKLKEMGLDYQEIKKLLIDMLEVIFNRKVVTADQGHWIMFNNARSL